MMPIKVFIHHKSRMYLNLIFLDLAILYTLKEKMAQLTFFDTPFFKHGACLLESLLAF